MDDRDREILRIRREIEARIHDCVRSFQITPAGSVEPVEIMRDIIDNGSCYQFMLRKLRYTQKAGSPSVNFEIEYTHGRFTLRNMLMKVEERAREIRREIIRPEMSPLLKCFVIHNYLLDTVAYDYESTGNPLRYSYAHSAYGALIEGRSVCQGIADACKMIMDACGEACCNIHGEAKSSDDSDWVGHAWNMVPLADGYYAHVDVTFDIGVASVDKYMYFGKNASFMNKDHRWKTDLYPRSNGNLNAIRIIERELSAKRKQLRESGVPEKYLRI